MTISSTAVVFRFPNQLELLPTPLLPALFFLLTRISLIFSSRLERPYVSLQLKRARQSDLEEKRASAKEERKNLPRPTMGHRSPSAAADAADLSLSLSASLFSSFSNSPPALAQPSRFDYRLPDVKKKQVGLQKRSKQWRCRAKSQAEPKAIKEAREERQRNKTGK